MEALGSLGEVVAVERHRLLCSHDGKSWLENRIRENALTHLVIAACSPRDHEQIFMEVCGRAGLNPHLFQLANVREHCAWTTDRKEGATEKAIKMTRIAIARVRYQAPLEKKEIGVNPDVLVVGGGVAGLRACAALASQLRKVFLVESTDKLGGMIARFEKAFPDMRDVKSYLEDLVNDVRSNPRIEVMTEAKVERIIGFFGNFEIVVRTGGADSGTTELRVGAVILATGAALADPKSIEGFDLSAVPDVLTALEFEDMNRRGCIVCRNGSAPKSVAIIHCVGREEKGYCSGICCMYSLKFSRYLTEKISSVQVTHLYRDMCVPGRLYQDYFKGSLGDRVKIVRHLKSRVTEKDGRPIVLYEDANGAENALDVDMVILAPAMEPADGSRQVAEVAGIPLDKEGFLLERHPKLATESSGKDGIYIAGCAQEPKSIEESIIQAEAVAGKIMASLVPGRKIEPEVRISTIAESFCQGCGSCVAVCSYGAVSLDERRKVAVVNEVICRGCGNCAAACPSGAASIRHYTRSQIYQEIMEAVR